MVNPDFKIYSLVGFDGHAFDGIKMHDSELPKLIEKLDKQDVKIVAIQVNKDSVELLTDIPLTAEGTKAVKLTETIIDRVGKVEAIKS